MPSQYDEDWHILRSLRDLISSAGLPLTLLEIGAWDPIQFSNSRALIEHGWNAVLVEPSPGPVKNLVREYASWKGGAVRVICAAITTEPCGLVEINVTDDALSVDSASPRAGEWAKDGGYYGKLLVPSLSVKQLFDQFGGGFEFVSIDTEGSSLALMKAMLELGPRPRVICVEHDGRIVEAMQIAEAANYRQAHLNQTNVIYEWTGARE